MSLSPICFVNNLPIPIAANGVTGFVATAGSTITISLANPAGVNVWNINCTETDGFNQFSTVAFVEATKIQNPGNYTATFVVPLMDGYLGASLQFTSNVNNDPKATTTFGVFILNSDGSRLFFPNENLETNTITGVVYDLNALKEAQISISNGSGGYTNQVVISTNYSINSSNQVINVSGPVSSITITLPASPSIGESHTIVDRTASAWLLPFTISGGTNNIENANTFIMTGEYTCCTFVWCSSRWMVISSNFNEPIYPLPTVFPKPPNGDYWRAMWSFNNVPLLSDAARASFISFCQANNVNLVFQVTNANLQDTQYSLTHELQLMKFNSDCYRNGIHVHALLSNEDGYNAYWGDNANYMMTKAINPLANFQQRARSSKKYPNAAFQGISMDNEWWASSQRPEGYGAKTVKGYLDLVKTIRLLMPGIPIGHSPASFMANNGIVFGYDGYYGSEGFHLMNNLDYVVVQAYANNATSQISMMNPWFNYASLTGINCTILCGTDVDPGQSYSYNTGSPGDKANMEVNLTIITNNYVPQATNSQNVCAYGGVSIEEYGNYQNMQ